MPDGCEEANELWAGCVLTQRPGETWRKGKGVEEDLGDEPQAFGNGAKEEDGRSKECAEGREVEALR